MKTKFLTMGLLGSLAFGGLATPAFADGEEAAASPWSATLAVTSDYRFRGQSQTQRDPALQGSIDFASETGFFAGVWASNIDFNDPGDTSIEVDLYAGVTQAISDKTEATFKVVYYAYPDQDNAIADYDYVEVLASLSHDFGAAAVTGEIAWSPDYFAQTGSAVALTGTLAVPLADKFWFFDGGLSASGHAGYQWIDDNIAYGTPDYVYFDVGLSAVWGLATFDVRWIDTDLDKTECYGGLDLCEGGVVGTVSFAFGG
ncbi:MAG: TorF family putative porin [Alphaproteobacteria bacterium]|nr:TorF family putative porin [Alphaproteobacteria bacterium]